MRRQAKPRPARVVSTMSMAPASAGVTEGRRISSFVRLIASIKLAPGVVFANVASVLDRNDPMPKIDIAAAPTRFGTGYPPPYDAPCLDRKRWKLGDAA